MMPVLFCISKDINLLTSDYRMKKLGLLSAALLLSAGVFAQSEPKNEHGMEVRSAAQANSGGSRGAEVSSTAAIKAHSDMSGVVDVRQSAKESRKARKAERVEAVSALKADQKAVRAELREDLKTTVKAGSEDMHDLKAETRADLKAGVESSRSDLADARAELVTRKRELRKAAREERRAVQPVKAKVKTDTGVQLRRPKIKGALHAGAAVGL